MNYVRLVSMVVLTLGLLPAETWAASVSWFGDWGPGDWLEELCHWAGLCDTVCYGELGCFSGELPCHTDFFPPMRPEEIDTRFSLYTRGNRDVPTPLNPIEPKGKWRREFDGRRLRTVFVIHGWVETGKETWIQELKDALLDKDDVNVITVDWMEGAYEPNYMKSVQNVRVVGREVSRMIRFLQSQTGLVPASVHLIGYSLGAHVAGYAGKDLRGIGRITGLDAAGPAFENTSAACRLDRSDAMFVDVIHTSYGPLLKGGVGIRQKIGHMDFYPNGGQEQPGCSWWMPSCSHARSHAYFIQSVRDYCSFPAIPCDSKRDFKTGICRSCGASGCPSMGYDAVSSPARGNFYLKTRRKAPYCFPKYHSLPDKHRRHPGSKNDIITMKKGKTSLKTKTLQSIYR